MTTRDRPPPGTAHTMGIQLSPFTTIVSGGRSAAVHVVRPATPVRRFGPAGGHSPGLSSSLQLVRLATDTLAAVGRSIGRFAGAGAFAWSRSVTRMIDFSHTLFLPCGCGVPPPAFHASRRSSFAWLPTTDIAFVHGTIADPVDPSRSFCPMYRAT